MELNLKNIALATAIYLGIVYMSKNKVEQRFNSFRLQIVDVDIDFQRIRLTVNLQNPTSGNIVIRSIVGDLFVNGEKLANVQSFGYYNIPANGQYQFNVEGRFKPNNMINAIMAAVQGNKMFDIVFNGTININSTPMPLTFKYRVNGGKY